LIEIDPREGSGVIPLDWEAYLEPVTETPDQQSAVAGIMAPKLRQIPALSGVSERDYNYDAFWVVFPFLNGNKKALFTEAVNECELLVRIYNKEGRVRWKVPASIRLRATALEGLASP
jgi:hypothetical protein